MAQGLDNLMRKKRKDLDEEYLKTRKKASKLTEEQRMELARRALLATVKHVSKK